MIVVNDNEYLCGDNCQGTSSIPRYLHFIWVGEEAAPPKVSENVIQWKNMMEDWNVRIWTNDDLTLDNFPKKLLDRVHKAQKGAQKADILRYYIVYQYGGVYLDTDMTPYRTLNPIFNHFKTSTLFLCHDLPLTWPYIINSFFAAIPRHPILKKCYKYCINKSRLNTRGIHLQTGPRILGRFAWDANDDVVLLPTIYFYRNEHYQDRFATHTYAASWVEEPSGRVGGWCLCLR